MLKNNFCHNEKVVSHLWSIDVLIFCMAVIVSGCAPRSMAVPTLTITPQPIQTFQPTWTPTPMLTLVPAPSPRATPASDQATLSPDARLPQVGTSINDLLVVPTPIGPTATPPGEDIADPNYILGKQAYQNDDYAAVLKFMSLVLQTNPNLAPAYWYRGMAYEYQNNSQAALNEFQMAVGLDPDYALGYVGRGLAYIELGNTEQSMADWHKALTLDPTLAKVHHNFGVIAFNKGDYYTALREFTIALSIDPDRADTWSSRSVTLLKLAQYSACIASADRAINLQPDLWNSYFNRGSCEADLQNYAAAITDLEIFVKAVPDNPDGWYNLGIARRHSNQPQQAVDDYSRAIALKPTYGWAYINQGAAYMDLQQYDLALADYTKALTVGQYPIAYVGQGDAHLKLGKYAEAALEYQKAIALLPGYTEAYDGLAEADINLKQYQSALDNAATALQTELHNDRRFNLMQIHGRAYYGLGQYNQASAELYLLTTLRSEPLDNYYLGITYQAAGQKEQAILYLTRFINDKSGRDQTKLDDAKTRLEQLGH